MAKQRYINTKFWEDGYISNLDPSEKLIFLYLLTNSATNICGVYEIPLKRIATDTGYDKDMVIKIMDRFSNDNKILYRDGWIAIKNFIKHQNKNPKVELGIQIEKSKAPKWAIDFIDTSITNDGNIDYTYAIDSLSHLNYNTNLNANSNHNPENDALPVPVVNKLDHNHLAYKAAKYLFDSIVNNSNPTKWIKNPPNLNNWAIDIDKLNRIDGIDYDKIKDVIDFCTSHKFWKSNILSASCLREKFTKLEAQMPKATQKAQRELNFVDNAFEEAKIRNMTIDELISLDPHIRSVLAGKDLTEYRKKYRM